MTAPDPLRVAVAGTTFGRLYLEAVERSPHLQLAGILARGGARSAAEARARGVPLWTDPADVDADAACVVLRSGALGGAGAAVTTALLDRGVSVLQEQPAHPDEIADALRRGRRHGAVYRLNPFYPHLGPVRAFLAAADWLRDRRRVLFCDAAGGVAVAQPLVDVLGRAVGRRRPWEFTALDTDVGAYRSVTGMLGGVPLTLRLQHELHPDDPDNHAHQLMAVRLGTDAGVLELVDTHGPVVWTPRIHLPRAADGAMVPDPSTVAPDAPGGAEVVHPGTPGGVAALLDRVWPDAIGHALAGFAADVARSAGPQEAHDVLSSAQAWHDLMGVLGAPASRRSEPPRPLPAAAVRAGLADHLSSTDPDAPGPDAPVEMV